MAVKIVQRNHTYGINIELVVWECAECGVVYGVPKSLADNCRKSGARYYCPNGHSLGWDETEADLMRAEAETAKRNAAFWRSRNSEAEAEAAREKRRAAAYKGQITKARKRTGAGVCPVDGCKRHFPNLQGHMETVHPKHKNTEPTT